MDLMLVASELANVINENDSLTDTEIYNIAYEYLKQNYGGQMLACNYDYVIDTAYKIYEKI